MPEIEGSEKRQGLHLPRFAYTRVESKRNSPSQSRKTGRNCERRAGLRQIAETRESVNPLAGFDWKGTEGKLQAISSASGGRLYSLETIADLPAIYDDMMENLKVRYVISWRSSTRDGNPNTSHSVRVELVNPENGRPLDIMDTKGRRVTASIVLQGSYTPATALPGENK
jgi:hypothetical protein